MSELTVPIIISVGIGLFVTWIGLAILFANKHQKKEKQQRISKSTL